MKKLERMFSNHSLIKYLNKVRQDKNGSVLLEFGVFLSIFFFVLWCFINVVLFLYGNFQMAQATNDAVENIVKKMRGSDSITLSSEDINNVGRDIRQMVNQMGIVEIYRDAENQPIIVLNDRDECKNEKSNNRNVICAYVLEYEMDGRIFQKVVLEVQSGFRPVGNFIPGISNIFHIKGIGVAEKEFAGRYKYID